jgi:gamma-glutamylcyclotransferase (GGCT)/AIG2-like uncharacterized protein YtfP
MSVEEKENLFSYGTLQNEEVQLTTFGRRLEGKPDVLVGYRLAMIETLDQTFVAKSGATHHRTLQFTGNASDSVSGTVFTVTEEELAHADAYEPTDYKRGRIQMRSGLSAWAYLSTRR